MRKRPVTQGNQFKQSMLLLMKNLLAKTPNYIRCIKPNEDKRAKVFDKTLVRNQVRYLGLLENVRVRRAGFAHRQTYSDFVARYKMLSVATWPKSALSDSDSTKAILDECCVPGEECAFGSSKIFIRAPNVLFKIEEMRVHRLIKVIALIQAQWRMFAQRRIYRRMQRAQVLIAARWRGFVSRRDYLAQKKATLTIQSFYRGMEARKLLAKYKLEALREKSATCIAAYWRGYLARREYARYFRAHASPIIARFMDRVATRKYLLHLRDNLPQDSPTDTSWPSPLYKSKHFERANVALREIHHRWRCAKYMSRLSTNRQRLFTDKLECESLFCDKALYRSQLPLVYRSDYINLGCERKWEELNDKVN